MPTKYRFRVTADSTGDRAGEDASDARSIGTLLTGPGSPAAAFLAQAERLGIYGRAVREWSALHACATPRAVNLRDGVLVIHVDNAASGTALRFRSTELLRFLQDRVGTDCLRVDVKIRPFPTKQDR